MGSSMWQFHVKTVEKPNNRRTVSGLLEMAMLWCYDIIE